MRFLFLILLFTFSCKVEDKVTKVTDVSDIEYLNNSHSDFTWDDYTLYVYDVRLNRFITNGQSLTHHPSADVTIHKVAGAITVENDTLIDTKAGYKVYVTHEGTTTLNFVRNILN